MFKNNETIITITKISQGSARSRFLWMFSAVIQVQEIHLTTSLDQEGIKKALQRVLERVP